jgi:hypothetical protein
MTVYHRRYQRCIAGDKHSFARFFLIGSVVDTGDKFFTNVVDTAEKLSPVTMTPLINFRWYQ